MSEQKFVIYHKYNGHIVCDIYDRYKIFDSEFEAIIYIRNKNLNKIDFIVERREKFDQRTTKEIQSVKVGIAEYKFSNSARKYAG